jgi:hypothetical protein
MDTIGQRILGRIESIAFQHEFEPLAVGTDLVLFVGADWQIPIRIAHSFDSTGGRIYVDPMPGKSDGALVGQSIWHVGIAGGERDDRAAFALRWQDGQGIKEALDYIDRIASRAASRAGAV